MKRFLFLLSATLAMMAGMAQAPITDTGTLRTTINAEIVTNGSKAITAAKLNRILNGYLNVWPRPGYGLNGIMNRWDVDTTLIMRRTGWTPNRVPYTNNAGVWTVSDLLTFDGNSLTIGNAGFGGTNYLRINGGRGTLAASGAGWEFNVGSTYPYDPSKHYRFTNGLTPYVDIGSHDDGPGNPFTNRHFFLLQAGVDLTVDKLKGTGDRYVVAGPDGTLKIGTAPGGGSIGLDQVLAAGAEGFNKTMYLRSTTVPNTFTRYTNDGVLASATNLNAQTFLTPTGLSVQNPNLMRDVAVAYDKVRFTQNGLITALGHVTGTGNRDLLLPNASGTLGVGVRVNGTAYPFGTDGMADVTVSSSQTLDQVLAAGNISTQPIMLNSGTTSSIRNSAATAFTDTNFPGHVASLNVMGLSVTTPTTQVIHQGDRLSYLTGGNELRLTFPASLSSSFNALAFPNKSGTLATLDDIPEPEMQVGMMFSANNLSDVVNVATARTNLGASTVGANLFTYAPAANANQRWFRLNADNSITARTGAETKIDLLLQNVENTALSTWAGSANLTTVGTIGTGVWNATPVAENKVASAAKWNTSFAGMTQGLNGAFVTFNRHDGTKDTLAFSINLTTNGKTGAAEWDEATQTLNIPDYTPAVTAALAPEQNRLAIYSANNSIQAADALTPNRVLVSDAGGLPVAAAVTTTELNHLAGVTGNVQAQINALSGGSGGSGSAQKTTVMKIMKALGSDIKAETHEKGVYDISSNQALVSGTFTVHSVWLDSAATISSIAFYQGTQGSYTDTLENRLGLYTWNAGTLTLVAQTANDGSIWKGGTAQKRSASLTAPYNAQPGLYYIGALYNGTAQVTAPAVGRSSSLNALAMGIMHTGTAGRLMASITGQNTLPTTITLASMSTYLPPHYYSLH